MNYVQINLLVIIKLKHYLVSAEKDQKANLIQF